MSIILLRRRAFCRACRGACPRACRWDYRKICQKFRHNFPQVFVPCIFPHHSAFSFFFICVPFLLPTFRASRSNVRAALLLSCSWHKIISCRNRIKMQYCKLSINQSINTPINNWNHQTMNHSIISSTINLSLNLSVTPLPYTAKRLLSIIKLFCL